MRAGIVLVLLMLMCSFAQAATGDRVALVIGNATYENGALRNPGNDAADVSAKLQSLGFQVVSGTNLDRDGMFRKVQEFRSALKPGGVGLFFYSGHGVEVAGRNYLLPVNNAVIRTVEDVEIHGFEAQRLVSQMEAAGTQLNVVILDACRDNPLPSTVRSASKGLGRMDAQQGTLIAYATKEGQVAADGSGRNSPYTQALLKHLGEPGLEVSQLFNRVGLEVSTSTRGVQVPWVSSSPVPPVMLAGVGPLARPAGRNGSDGSPNGWHSADRREQASYVMGYLMTREVRKNLKSGAHILQADMFRKGLSDAVCGRTMLLSDSDADLIARNWRTRNVRFDLAVSEASYAGGMLLAGHLSDIVDFIDLRMFLLGVDGILLDQTPWISEREMISAENVAHEYFQKSRREAKSGTTGTSAAHECDVLGMDVVAQRNFGLPESLRAELRIRVQVLDGFNIASSAKVAVAEFYHSNERFPESNQQVGLEAPEAFAGALVSRVAVGRNGAITVTLGGPSVDAGIRNTTLNLSPKVADSSIEWICTAQLRQELLPEQCQGM